MPTTTPKTAALTALAEAHAARVAADRAELEAVAAARSDGATWQEVADATGLAARQNAEKKYAKRLQEERIVTVREPGKRDPRAAVERMTGCVVRVTLADRRTVEGPLIGADGEGFEMDSIGGRVLFRYGEVVEVVTIDDSAIHEAARQPEDT